MDVIMMVIAATAVIVALPGAILETLEVLKTFQRTQDVEPQTDVTASQS